MKRFILVLVVMALLPITTAYAQVAVVDAAVTAAIANTWVEQATFWFQQAKDMIQSIEHFETMIEKTSRQIDLQVDNLNNLSKVHNYNDFVAWHNRQLYLERRTEETVKNMDITIGKKKYNIMDVEGMAYGFNDTFIDYWNKEFTEKQRREMWTNLGLTPSNYAYIKTWEAREQKIVREFLAAREIHNEEYKNNMEKNKDRKDALEKDQAKSKDDPTKMGDKGILNIIADTTIDTNKAINDLNGHMADIKEQKAIEIYQKNTPVNQPPMSEWPTNVIQPLKK